MRLSAECATGEPLTADLVRGKLDVHEAAAKLPDPTDGNAGGAAEVEPSEDLETEDGTIVFPALPAILSP